MTIDQAQTDTETLTEANDPILLPAAAARELLRGLPWQRFAVVGDSVAAGTGDPWPGYEDIPWGRPPRGDDDRRTPPTSPTSTPACTGG